MTENSEILVIPNEILSPTLVKPSGRIENNLSSYLLALVGLSRSTPEELGFSPLVSLSLTHRG